MLLKTSAWVGLAARMDMVRAPVSIRLRRSRRGCLHCTCCESARLLLPPHQFRDALEHAQRVPPDTQVLVVLGEPADLVEHLPPPDRLERPQRGYAVLGPLVLHHR